MLIGENPCYMGSISVTEYNSQLHYVNGEQMPVAEIIAIGTELLLGDIQDTNTHFLARFLRNHGIDLYRTTIVGDNIERVAQVIQESTSRSQIIITTGGLGPTVDDPTRQAVALSQGVTLEYHQELWNQIETRFNRFNRKPTKNNRRQAYIPHGAIAIENPVGTAPCFIIDRPEYCIISLPGVPSEMEFLIIHAILPYLDQRYNLHTVIKARILHTAGVGESQVDEWISDLETNTNPTVGLLAHTGQVDIRIAAKAETELEADKMIEDVAKVIYNRLGDHIYGEDSSSLENTILKLLPSKRLVIIESGFDNLMSKKLVELGFPMDLIISIENPNDPQVLLSSLDDIYNINNAEWGLGALLEPEGNKYNLHVAVKSSNGSLFQTSRSYLGAPENAKLWATNISLDFLRRNILLN